MSSPRAAGTDGRGDGRDTDAGDGCGAQAGENDAGGKRQLDLPEALGSGHAERFGDVDQGGIDTAYTGVGVAQDGQQRVAGERENGEAGGIFAEPRDGQQKPKKRERGNDLNDVSDGDHRFGKPLVAREQDAEREPDGRGEQDGEQREPQVLEREAADFGAMAMKEVTHGARPERNGGRVRCPKRGPQPQAGRRRRGPDRER